MGLDLVQIVMEAEEEFDVSIDHDQVPLTAGELLHALLAALHKQRPGRFADSDDRNEVWNQLRAMIANQLGVPLDQVLPNANFITDLGCV